MSLQKQLTDAMKTAMKAKDSLALHALRAIKSELLLAKTSGSGEELSENHEIKILQKLVKQRKESAKIFNEQGREDLAKPELEQAEVIAKFLPEQLSEDEIEKVVAEVIRQTGAVSMKDMGKVMGLINAKLAGRADGKTISTLVKQKLMA